tara:strand:+ start:300 stop:473 length:174 start_codon:yes stop_codon:yes gene_type:complete
MEYLVVSQPNLTKIHRSLTDDNYLTHIIYANKMNVTDEQRQYHLGRAKALIEEEKKE